jgi:hypothetical protein
MSIFGISMLDLYGLTFLSALFTEISFITTNIFQYLTNTSFYGIISGFFGHKVETSKQGTMRSTDKISTGNQESSKIIERFNQIIHKEEIKEDNSPFYQNKFFIWGSFLLISAVTYYYFGDEIKVYSLTLWDWLKGRRPGVEPGPNNNINPETRYNSWVNLIGWNKNTTKNLNISEILDDGVGLVDTNAIAGPSSEPMDNYFTNDLPKAKDVLTSPSLENLNSTVAEGWSNSRPTSPESITSTETIKPIITVTSNQLNEASSSKSIFKHDEIPKSMIDNTSSRSLLWRRYY